VRRLPAGLLAGRVLYEARGAAAWSCAAGAEHGENEE
jgi:hypothetical protein